MTGVQTCALPIFIDQETERRYTPLRHVAPDQGRFEVVNSMLSEEAVLGFEYGYSLAEPSALYLHAHFARRGCYAACIVRC